MSFTALFWAILYLVSIAGSFVYPLFGSLGYLLEYYMRPELKWWGKDLPSLRYNLIISLVFGVTYLMRRESLRPMPKVSNPTVRWLLAMAAVMALVTATVAVNQEVSFNWAVQWVKMAIIFPLLLAAVVRTPGAFDAFVATHILGAFWWGWDAWTRPKRAQGRLMEIGSGDTFNDNAASAHLLTVLPFIVIYILTQKDKRLRTIALVAAPFVMNTIILCNSRGSMVGMAVAMAVAPFLIRSGNRLKMVGTLLATGALVLLLADDTFIRRQQTTTDYEEDGSAQSRLITWQGAYRLIQDRPLGAGGRGFHLLSPVYIPDVVAAHRGDGRAPHNTWIMVACEWGIAGLICFIGLNASALLMLERLKRRVKDLGPDGNYYYWRALAIQLALIAGLVAAAFTDRLYGESGYWMIGLAYALHRMQIADQAEKPVAAEVPAETGWVAASPAWGSVASAQAR
jgi:O-antigen ligase